VGSGSTTVNSYAYTFGVIAAITTMLQYVPQIYTTYQTKVRAFNALPYLPSAAEYLQCTTESRLVIDSDAGHPSTWQLSDCSLSSVGAQFIGDHMVAVSTCRVITISTGVLCR
jgi:hypothetical protein